MNVEWWQAGRYISQLLKGMANLLQIGLAVEKIVVLVVAWGECVAWPTIQKNTDSGLGLQRAAPLRVGLCTTFIFSIVTLQTSSKS